MEACGTLSITYSGWLSPRSELAPRIVTEEAEPTAEEVELTTRPATLPDNKLSRELALAASFWTQTGQRTCYVAFTRRTVTYHNYLVQQLRVVLHCHINHRLVTYRDLLLLITDERKNQY